MVLKPGILIAPTFFTTKLNHKKEKIMRVEKISIIGNWHRVKDAAMVTIGSDCSGLPNKKWMKKIILAEHSPIRLLSVEWTWIDLPYWVSTHFVRHHVGIDHFVQSQRSDRTGIDRHDLPQGALVTHRCRANYQAMINVSRKRLCRHASLQTRKAWCMVLDELQKKDAILSQLCVSECVYRGFCPEFKSCGFVSTCEYVTMRDCYVKNVGRTKKQFKSK